MNFKTKSLSRKAIEHLIIIGIKTTDTVEQLADSPYLTISDDVMSRCFSVNQYKNFVGVARLEAKVLKMQRKLLTSEFNKLTTSEKDAHKLVKILNNAKNSKITGYDVSWTMQKNNDNRVEILPITNTACGSISIEHLEVILQFAKDHPYLSPSIGYTDWNNEKKRYGTYTPCVIFW